MWIDSHCHLNHSGIFEKGTPSDIIAQAHDAGVDGMLTICCRISEESETLIDIADHHDNVWCSIGTHPHDAALPAEMALSAQDIIHIATGQKNVIAIGESGLDYFYEHAPRAEQQESFRKHIHVCMETGLPLIVHTRDAEEDTIEILKDEINRNKDKKLRGVMHCFSGSQWLADQALSLGFYISLSGILTFKNAHELRSVSKNIPHNRILVETDAPFLAPVPYRGKINEPAYVSETGAFIADFLGIEKERFAKITSDNFFRLFDRAQII